MCVANRKKSLSNGYNPGNADNGRFRDCFMFVGYKMGLIIHDNRKFAKRAFYCMMNTGFGAFGASFWQGAEIYDR